MGWLDNNDAEIIALEGDQLDRLGRIEYIARRNHATLIELTQKVDRIMADLTALTASVAALNTAVTSAVTDLGALSADIVALKAQVAAGASDPTLQASIDALNAQVGQITGTLTTATAANPA